MIFSMETVTDPMRRLDCFATEDHVASMKALLAKLEKGEEIGEGA